MFTTHDILDLAIQLEKNGESVYREAGEHVADPTLASLFVWLADEERNHAEWFSNLKDEIKASNIDPEIEEMGRSILLDMLGDQIFSLKDVDLSRMETTDPILRKAVEFEKDTVVFYEMIGSFVEDEDTLEDLKRIIDEENRHVEALRDLLAGKVKRDGPVIHPSGKSRNRPGPPHQR